VIICRVDNVSRHGSGYSTDPKDDVTCTKIFYASRTHSQLAQVLPEMSKLKLPGKDISIKNYHLPPQYSLPQKRRTADDDVDDERSFDSATPVRVTRTVSLGSRKQLCINDELRQKTRDLDEACRELLGGERQFIKLLLEY
jgi:chromosome transmission fidelity protein 1